jgi:hypothetical protein
VDLLLVQGPSQPAVDLVRLGGPDAGTFGAPAPTIVVNPASSLGEPTLDPVAASARVVESAIELARAEARLVMTRISVVGKGLVSVLIAAAIALPLLQVTVLLLAISPIIGAERGVEHALLAVGISLPGSVISAYLAIRAARSLARDLEHLSRGE